MKSLRMKRSLPHWSNWRKASMFRDRAGEGLPGGIQLDKEVAVGMEKQ